MESPPLEIEFEHRRLKPGVVPPSLSPAPGQLESLNRHTKRRAQLWRALFVVGGAAAIAWATQRAGIGLSEATCLFLGTLPVLWVSGWLFGFLFHGYRSAKRLRLSMGSQQWQKELEAASETEHIKLSVSAEGLRLTRNQHVELIDWKRLNIARLGPNTLAVFLPHPHGLVSTETLNVPRSAFESDGSFDAFCIHLQRLIWEGQRVLG